jgi:hypothetical protein
MLVALRRSPLAQMIHAETQGRGKKGSPPRALKFTRITKGLLRAVPAILFVPFVLFLVK